MIMKYFKPLSKKNPFLYFVILFSIMFLLKAYIVQVIYNQIWPKFVSNMGQDTTNFKQIDYSESLLLVILFRFLF